MNFPALVVKVWRRSQCVNIYSFQDLFMLHFKNQSLRPWLLFPDQEEFNVWTVWYFLLFIQPSGLTSAHVFLQRSCSNYQMKRRWNKWDKSGGCTRSAEISSFIQNESWKAATSAVRGRETKYWSECRVISGFIIYSIVQQNQRETGDRAGGFRRRWKEFLSGFQMHFVCQPGALHGGLWGGRPHVSVGGTLCSQLQMI